MRDFGRLCIDFSKDYSLTLFRGIWNILNLPWLWSLDFLRLGSDDQLSASTKASTKARASVFLRCYASKILTDETDFQAILPKGELAVIVHTILSLERYGKKFTDIKVLEVYEELLAVKL